MIIMTKIITTTKNRNNNINEINRMKEINNSGRAMVVVVVLHFDRLALEKGEDVFIAHQKMAGHQHEVVLDAARVVPDLRHQLDYALHGQALREGYKIYKLKGIYK